MHREEAIALIVSADIVGLSEKDRRSILSDWWSIDDADVEYCGLTPELQSEMKMKEEPDNANDGLYDPLLKIALKHKFIGVINSYLETRLAEIGRHENVTGDVELLRPCVCCGYHTLSQMGWGVCPVCFWEEDGVLEMDSVSGANHMSLREARTNFGAIGAIREAHVRHVLEDGKERYLHE